jgi:hypothetical protein
MSMQKVKTILATVFTVLGGLLIFIGITWKIMHWPFAGAFILAGLLFLIPGFIILLLNLFQSHFATETKNENTRIFFALYLISLLISCAFLGGGIIFRFLHWPYAGFGILIGSPFLILTSFFYSRWQKYKEAEKITDENGMPLEGAEKNETPGFLRCVAPALIIIGALFKILHWPGSVYFLIAGFAALALDFLLPLVKRKT